MPEREQYWLFEVRRSDSAFLKSMGIEPCVIDDPAPKPPKLDPKIGHIASGRGVPQHQRLGVCIAFLGVRRTRDLQVVVDRFNAQATGNRRSRAGCGSSRGLTRRRTQRRQLARSRCNSKSNDGKKAENSSMG